MRSKLLSVLAFVVLVAAMVYLLMTGQLLGHGPLTIGLQVAAFLLMVWARVTFGSRSFHAAANPTSGGLVTTGPYRFVRHPIYAAIWLFVWTGVAANLSWASGAAGVVVAAALVARMLPEERLVIQQYPEYTDYARRTQRVLPGVF